MSILSTIIKLILGEHSVAKAVKNIDKAIVKLDKAVIYQRKKADKAAVVAANAKLAETNALEESKRAARIAEKMEELLS